MNLNYREIETERDYRIAEYRRQAQEDAFANLVRQQHPQGQSILMAAVRKLVIWIKARRPQPAVPASKRTAPEGHVTNTVFTAAVPQTTNPSNE